MSLTRNVKYENSQGTLSRGRGNATLHSRRSGFQENSFAFFVYKRRERRLCKHILDILILLRPKKGVLWLINCNWSSAFVGPNLKHAKTRCRVRTSVCLNIMVHMSRRVDYYILCLLNSRTPNTSEWPQK